MSLVHPWWALLIVPLAAALLLVRLACVHWVRVRTRAAGAGVAHLTCGIDRSRERWRTGLWLTCWCALAAALAGPRWGWAPAPPAVSDAPNVVVALDCSRSMLATDTYPDRLRAAQRLLVDLSHAAAPARFALLPFAGVAELRCPYTDAGPVLTQLTAQCTPELFPVEEGLQGTDIAGVLHQALLLASSGRERGSAILVLSDGGDDDPAAYAGVAADAITAGIPIHAVVFGTTAASASIIVDGRRVAVRAQEDGLRQLARATGGICIRAEGAHALEATLAQAVRATTPHDRSAASPPRGRVPAPRYQLFAAAALLAAAAATIIRTRRRVHGLGRQALCALALMVLAIPHAQAVETADGAAVERALAQPRAAAIASLMDLAARWPQSPTVQYDLGTLLLEGAPAQAASHLRAAAALAAGDVPLQARCDLQLAVAELRQGRFLAAERALARTAAAPGEAARALRTHLQEQCRLRHAAWAAAVPAEAPTLPPARVGEAYAARWGPGSWRLRSAPVGWSLDAEGVLHGVPDHIGTIVLIAAPAADSMALTLVPLPVLPPSAIVTSLLPPAVAGMPYRILLRAEGCGWARWRAVGLPPGIALVPASIPDAAWLQGIASAPGRWLVALTTDRDDAVPVPPAARLPLPVEQGEAAGGECAPATQGAAYAAELAWRAADAPWVWSAAPVAGLTLNRDGLLQGVPTMAGRLRLAATLRGPHATLAVEVVVPVAQVPVITCGSVLVLPAQRALAVPLSVAGGTPPYRWRTSGALPGGLHLDAAGILRGAAEPGEDRVVEVQVADRWNAAAQASVTIHLLATAPARTTPPPQASGTAITSSSAAPATASGTGGSHAADAAPAADDPADPRGSARRWLETLPPEDQRALRGIEGPASSAPAGRAPW